MPVVRMTALLGRARFGESLQQLQLNWLTLDRIMKKGAFEQTARRYDAVASQYREAKALPFQGCVVCDTLFRLVGLLEGKKVLDLGCGKGHYTRLLKRRGAADVLRVDISRAM